MAKRRVKARASSTNLGASNHGPANSSQEEVTVSSPSTVNGEGVEVPSEIKNEDKNISGGGTNEEVAGLVMKNGEVVVTEEEIKNDGKYMSEEGTSEEVAVLKNGEVAVKEENEEAAIDKEKIEMAAIEGEVEDEGFDEPNSAEEKDEDQGEEAGEYWEEWDGEKEDDDDHEDDDDDDHEDDDDDDHEEEGEEKEGQMEIGDEETGEEEGEKEGGNIEEALLIARTEEKMEASFEGEAKKLMVRRRLKKVGTKVEDQPTSSKKIVISAAEDKLGASSGKKLASVEEDKPKTSIQKKVASTKEDKPKSSSEKKVTSTAEDKPEASSKKKSATSTDDKPEASSKKKVLKRAESMGLIFMCNSKTKKDCYRYNVLGLPASKKAIVQKVYKGMRLFLFDIDKRLMYGIYKAAGPGGYDIQPKAFGSAFPSQVRFTVLTDCLPLAEENFKPILKDNYYAKKKFDCQLNSEQVKNLCKLFNASGRSSRFRKAKNVAGAEIHPDADRARIGRPRVDEKRLGRGRIKRKRLDDESLNPRPRVDGERLDRSRIRRPRLDKERIEQGGIRRHVLHEERLDPDRMWRQRRDEERLDRDRVRHEESWDPWGHGHPVVYERERYASPLPPPSRAYDSLSRAHDPYLRTAEAAMYTRDPVVDLRERVPVLDHRGRLPAVDYRDNRILDLDIRHRDEVGIRDPYTSYREYNPPPRVQAATFPPLASSASEYRLPPLASSASQYRLPEEAPGYEYAPLRPLYRY